MQTFTINTYSFTWCRKFHQTIDAITIFDSPLYADLYLRENNTTISNYNQPNPT